MKVKTVRFYCAIAAAAFLTFSMWAAGPQSNSNNQSQTTTTTQSSATQTNPAGGITLPTGSRLAVRMTDSVNSDINKVGDTFRGTLDEDLVANGAVVAPKGSDVTGKLIQSNAAAGTPSGSTMAAPSTSGTNPSVNSNNPSSSQSAQSNPSSTSSSNTAASQNLTLAVTDVTINGKDYSLIGARTANATPPNTQSNPSSSNPSSQTANQSGTMTATMSASNEGAIANAVISSGGTTGNVTTGVGSGAAGTNQILIRGQHVVVPSQSVIEFRLEQPVTLDVNPSSTSTPK